MTPKLIPGKKNGTFGAVEVILLDKTDRKGLPNGDTQAVYVKLPTIFSRKMILMYLDCWTALIRLIHFFCFFSDNFQDLVMASYTKPKISISWVGE